MKCNICKNTSFISTKVYKSPNYKKIIGTPLGKQIKRLYCEACGKEIDIGGYRI